MRPQLVVGLATLALLIASAPALAQGVPSVPVDVPAPPAGVPNVPVAPPAAPDFIGQYQGVVYYVRDGVVERLDGAAVDPSAAQQVLNAQRAFDLLQSHTDLIQNLKDRAAGVAPASDPLGQARVAADRLRGVAGGLGAPDPASLLGGFLPSLPVDPSALQANAADLDERVLEALGHAENVQAASADAQRDVDSFLASHSVEDKVAMFQSFARAIPVYEAAARHLAGLESRLATAEGQLESILGDAESRAGGLLGSLGLPPLLVDDVEAAKSHVEGAKSDVASFRDALETDAAAMQSILSEPVDASFPVAWVLGGGAAAATLGLGSLWWLRRRAGLP